MIEEVRQIENITNFEGYDVVEILGKDRVEGIAIRSLTNGQIQTIPVAAVFIEVGLKPNSDIVGYLVERNEKGEIIIDRDCSTSAPGIFAAGDVTNVRGKRIVIASGEGAKAALAVKKYLLESERRES